MGFLRVAALGSLVALAPCFGASASPVPFTWDLSAASPLITGPAITADSISTTDFLFNRSNSAGVGLDTFILQINGFSLNGVSVSVPGLGTSYGLYIDWTVKTGAYYGPGTMTLKLDPTNNDGTVSSSWDPVTQTGSIGFSNAPNTADDITLATGNYLFGAAGTQSNGHFGAHFIQTFIPTVPGFLVSPTDFPLNLEEKLFNTSDSRHLGTADNGDTWATVNYGYGIADLVVPEPSSLTLLAVGPLVLAVVWRRRARRPDGPVAE